MTTEEGLKSKPRFLVVIDSERCKGCSLCVAACPKTCLKMSETINTKGYHFAEFIQPQNCNGCGFCYLLCPDTCIEVYRQDK